MTDQDHQLPLLPLRDVVVYPHMVLPLFVGRERSMEALEHAMLDLSLIHISEPTRHAQISYAVFCLKKKKKRKR